VFVTRVGKLLAQSQTSISLTVRNGGNPCGQGSRRAA
jgi:hypothetical protein